MRPDAGCRGFRYVPGMAKPRIGRRRPFRPLEAMRAIRALSAQPDDTSQVFRVIRSLGGRNFERLFWRVKADPVGAKILRDHRALTPVLDDRARLRALPEGSLGRTYASFVETEQISAAGLVAASQLDDDDPDEYLDPEAEVLGTRLRDMHDLWHVTTGLGRDLIGEAALLAFTYAQTRNRGIGAIAAVAYYKLRRARIHEGTRMIRRGFRTGRRAGLLPAADWERLLERPLGEVRERLHVEPCGAYTPLFSEGAPPRAEFQPESS